MAYMIKRYSNRKLYDTQESRYVTLEELEEMIRGGREIRVLDAATGEDLTSVTLAQIILENERAHRATTYAASLARICSSISFRCERTYAQAFARSSAPVTSRAAP